MSEISSTLSVSGIDVKVVRKAIKNLHLGVYPPNGQVRVAVPEHMTDDNVRLAVISKLGWIKRQQKDFQDQPRQSEREYISGECHYFLGKRYRLDVVEHDEKPQVKLLKSGKIKLFVRPNASIETKQKLLTEWYRIQLKRLIPELLDVWQPAIGKQADAWSVKQMKTKWGSCNTDRAHIWLNLELAKKPPECLEYILVHELIHLHERHHNERFRALMEKFMPNWRQRKKLLNNLPLAHEDWIY